LCLSNGNIIGELTLLDAFEIEDESIFEELELDEKFRKTIEYEVDCSSSIESESAKQTVIPREHLNEFLQKAETNRTKRFLFFPPFDTISNLVTDISTNKLQGYAIVPPSAIPLFQGIPHSIERLGISGIVQFRDQPVNTKFSWYAITFNASLLKNEDHLLVENEVSPQLQDLRNQLESKVKHLSGHLQPKAFDLLWRNRDRFVPKHAPAKDLPEAEFFVSGNPVQSRPYTVSFAEKDILRNTLQQLEQEGVIRQSRSNWASPVMLRKKANGERRFVVDYRKLNKQITRQLFTMPTLNDALFSLHGNKMFSSLDLKSGFHQIRLQEHVKKYTAFTTEFGNFEFEVLPQGLIDSPAIFQRTMQALFSGAIKRFLLLYIDDILIYSKSFHDHYQHLEHIFRELAKHDMTLSIHKCSFFQNETKYLGHIVNAEGIKPDPKKVSALQDYTPHNRKALRSFLGMIGFYRKFISGFASRSRPLVDWIHKSENVKEPTPKELLGVIDDLKSALTQCTLLTHPILKKTFTIHTDASDVGIEGVLSQDGRPIAFMSKLFSKAQDKYHTGEKEALAVVEAVEFFKPFIHGSHFKLVTDHNNLIWIFSGSAKSQRSHRIARWSLLLQEYDFEIIHKPGKSNVTADFLSRMGKNNKTNEIISEEKLLVLDDFKSSFAEEQRRDGKLRAILAFKTVQSLPYDPKLRRQVLRSAQIYEVHENILYHKGKVCLPSHLISEYMSLFHSVATAAHVNAKKVLQNLRSRYFWPSMRKDVENFVRSCLPCRLKKSSQPKGNGKLQAILTQAPFNTVLIDVLSGFPKSNRGNVKIIVMIDHFSNWPEAIAVIDESAETVAQVVFQDLICRHGIPERILTDNGGAFVSKLFDKLKEKLQIKSIHSSSYHPQGHGKVEKLNLFLQAAIAIISKDDKDWDLKLPAVLFAYRTSCIDHLEYSPYYILYGRHPRLPTDFLQDIETPLSPRDHADFLRKQHQVILIHFRFIPSYIRRCIILSKRELLLGTNMAQHGKQRIHAKLRALQRSYIQFRSTNNSPNSPTRTLPPYSYYIGSS
jgi:hypothetical protein